MKNLIPKTIYYCWFGGEKPQNVLDCIHNWQNMLPEYKIVEINETTFDVEQAKKDNLWFKTCYENKIWGVAIDYVRLKVLYENGGVYFDTDVTVEKDITDLVEKNKLIVGWEDCRSIGCGIVICPPKDKNIKKMLDFLSNEIWQTDKSTGPHCFTYILNKYYKLLSYKEITDNDDIIVLPPDYFCPLGIGSIEKDKANFITSNSYTIHWWSGTWCKSNIDYFMKHKHKIKLDRLLKMCFEKKLIINNPFIKIEKLFKNYTINIDFYYVCKFKYKYYKKNRWLTVFVLGIQIPLWRVK